MPAIEVKCKHCGKSLGELNFETFAKYYSNYDATHQRRTFCSEDCYMDYIKQFEIELYNGRPIYCFIENGEKRYVPYFSSPYYFTTIDDCKKRMDMPNIGIDIGMYE